MDQKLKSNYKDKTNSLLTFCVAAGLSGIVLTVGTHNVGGKIWLIGSWTAINLMIMVVLLFMRWRNNE